MMESCYRTLFEVIVNFYEANLFVSYCHHAFHQNKNNIFAKILFIFLIGGAYTLYLFFELPFVDTWVMVILMLYVLLFFSDHIIDRLFWTVTMIAVTYGIIDLSYSLYYWLFESTIIEVINSEYMRIPYAIFTNFLITIGLYVLLKQKEKCVFDKKSVALLGIINILCLGIVDVMFVLYEQLVVPDIWLFVIVGSSFLVSMLSIVLYRVISIFIMNNKERQEIQMYQNSLEEKLEKISKQYEMLRSIKHDLNNHINVAKRLYADGRQSDGEVYISQIEDRISSQFMTGCGSMDALLSIKCADFHQNGISFDYEICDVSNIPVSDFTLCAIISNLLDNAFESLERQKKEIEKPYLKLVILRNRNLLQINCSNPVNEKLLIKKKGEFVSSKGEHHGLGIKNIKKMVGEAKGECCFEVKDSCFIADIWIPYK